MVAPTLTKTDLEFGIKGLFYPNNHDEIPPPVTAPVMPYHDDTNPSLVQAYVSNYLADSLGGTFCKTIGINVWLKSDIVPAASPFQLNTKSMDILFPGLEAKYGNSSDIDLHLVVNNLSNFASVEE